MRAPHRSIRWLRGATLLGITAWMVSCDQQATQPTIDGFTIRAAKGGNGGNDDVKVRDTDPPGAPQDTRLLVKVVGSGFDETSQVEMLLDQARTADITTNSTTFVSSREVHADITIAPDATLDFFDVEVTAAGGRKRGIGIELFEITVKTQECQIKFDLTFGDFGGDGIADPMRSDGLGTYYSGVDRVGAGTGSGDGFRFDTNGSQKIEANNDRRWVTLDFSGTAFPGANETDGLGNPIPKGIDLRFTDHPDGTRLNLCALEVGESDHVPVTIRFNASDVEFNPSDANAELGYGGVSRGFDCGPPGVSEVTVTRTALDTWVLESGPTACYTTRDPDGTMNQFQFRGLVDMPFKFTIVAQP